MALQEKVLKINIVVINDINNQEQKYV